VTGALVLFALAELAVRLGPASLGHLPEPSTVLVRIGELLTDPVFLGELAATVQAWVLSLLIATAIGVGVGILLGSSTVTYRAASAVVDVLRPVPAIALLPLAVLVWGQGLEMKVVIVGFATLWPVLSNTIYGVHGIDPVALETGRAFGLGRWAMLRRIVLPGAAPMILTGIRISASLGLIVIVGTELIAGASSGIGSYILRISLAGERTDIVLASAAIAGLVGVLINLVFTTVERRRFAWSTRAQ
jgi:NitT/TauT family transport system permease protein